MWVKHRDRQTNRSSKLQCVCARLIIKKRSGSTFTSNSISLHKKKKTQEKIWENREPTNTPSIFGNAYNRIWACAYNVHSYTYNAYTCVYLIYMLICDQVREMSVCISTPIQVLQSNSRMSPFFFSCTVNKTITSILYTFRMRYFSSLSVTFCEQKNFSLSHRLYNTKALRMTVPCGIGKTKNSLCRKNVWRLYAKWS